jgi:hypothetical protein
MWKLAFIAATLCLSASPLDAAPKEGKRVEKTGRGEELRRDVDRISKEIYRPRGERPRRR